VNAPLASLQRAACAHGEDLPLVLADASLVAHAGELVVLIGKNGSGKSTLLSAMAGLLPLRSGRALLGDREAAALSRRERALRVAIVPQDAPPLFDVLAFDFVLAGRYARLPRWRRAPEEDLRAAQEALQACGAGDDGCKPLFELSGGARRRVLVARAIAQGAPLLLADEPTNALDPEHKLQVFDLLARLARGGLGVLACTHELDLAGQYADRIALLHDGRVAAEGRPAEILRPEVLEPIYGPRLGYALEGGVPLVWPSRALPR
jgi:iron complex transport system ATP-binding protein